MIVYMFKYFTNPLSAGFKWHLLQLQDDTAFETE